jgi:aryl sulfotransferase
MRRYRNFVHDSGRWAGFEFRPDDIVISTPPKCGTTWMQMLCAVLIFQTSEFDRALTVMSPWLDMHTAPIDEVLGRLAAQEHRRFIKTHTPLDGVPWDSRVRYIGVGRDPRDVAISWDNHMANMDFDAFLNHRINAVGLDDLAELGITEPPPPPPDDPVERLRRWVHNDEEAIANVSSLAGMLHHLDSFWQRRDEPNVALFHYDVLRRDLEGELLRLAEFLDIEVDRAKLPDLVEAASFERMKARADQLAPEVDHPFWLETGAFFKRGGSGGWREIMPDDLLREYEERCPKLASPDLLAWVHQK